MIGDRRNIYRDLERALGYRFRKRRFLETALVHRSFRFENQDVHDDNQRLEFLGDAVLGFVTAEHLFHEFSHAEEGALTALRSQVTSGKALVKAAKGIHLGDYMKIGRGEEKTGGRTRSSNLEDAMESVIGAAYLDGGVKAVRNIFHRLLLPTLSEVKDDVWAGNPKGKLQEYSQRVWKRSPVYHIVAREGPPHATIFTAEARIHDGLKGAGRGRNKQEAEAEAACQLLTHLEDSGEASG